MNKNCMENKILSVKGTLQPTILRAILNLYNGGLCQINARDVKDECKRINYTVEWNRKIESICNAMRNATECGGKIVGENRNVNKFSIEF